MKKIILTIMLILLTIFIFNGCSLEKLKEFDSKIATLENLIREKYSTDCVVGYEGFTLNGNNVDIVVLNFNVNNVKGSFTVDINRLLGYTVKTLQVEPKILLIRFNLKNRDDILNIDSRDRFVLLISSKEAIGETVDELKLKSVEKAKKEGKIAVSYVVYKEKNPHNYSINNAINEYFFNF